MATVFLRRYPLPIAYVGTLVTMSLVYAYALPAVSQRELVDWSSTNLANLDLHPMSAMAASAFLSVDPVIVWAVLTTLALYLIVRCCGNLRAALIIGTAHVAGTLVSEGTAAIRLAVGAAPSAIRHIADVGPSYVTVSALAAAAVCSRGRRPRAAAIVGWLLLAPFLFERIEGFDVAAIGHLVATLTGVWLGFLCRRAEPAVHHGWSIPKPAGQAGLSQPENAEPAVHEGRRVLNPAVQSTSA